MDHLILDEAPLSTGDKAFLDEHRQACPDCALEAAMIKELRCMGTRTLAQELDDTALERRAEKFLRLEGSREPQRPARSWRLTWAVVGSIAALAVVTSYLLLGGEQASVSVSKYEPGNLQPAKLALVSGAVRASGNTASAGDILHQDSVLSVSTGLAVLNLDNGASAIIGDESRLALVASTQDLKQFQLHNGRVTFGVMPLAGKQSFVVDIPSGRIRVLGTVFSISFLESEYKIRVAEGMVDFQPSDEQAIVVAAGQLLSQTGGLQDLPDSQRDAMLQQIKLSNSLPRGQASLLKIDTHPSGAYVRIDGQLLGQSHLSVLVTPGRREIVLSLAGHTPHNEWIVVPPEKQLLLNRNLAPAVSSAVMKKDQAPMTRGKSPVAPADEPPAGGGDRGKAAPKPRKVSTLEAAPTTTSPPQVDRPAVVQPTVAELLDRVHALRARSDWAGVVEAYQRLIRLYHDSAEARTCLVPMGQIQLRHLDQPRASLDSFKRYLESASQGSLSEEAEWGVLLALRRLNRTDEEIRRCSRFLKHYPEGIYAPKVRERLEVLTGASK